MLFARSSFLNRFTFELNDGCTFPLSVINDVPDHDPVKLGINCILVINEFKRLDLAVRYRWSTVIVALGKKLMMSRFDCLPYYAQGKVVSGFGRGSKDLGIPTANFPQDVVSQLPESLECGAYYGWASVDGVCEPEKMVLSVGWNVFYGNDVKTMETHILKQFDQDFYGVNLRIVILGFIRPMCNFDSLDALISAIHKDISDAEKELIKPENLAYKKSAFFEPAAHELTGERSNLVTNGSQLCISSCQERGVSHLQEYGVSQLRENDIFQLQENGVSQLQENGVSQLQENCVSQPEQNGISPSQQYVISNCEEDAISQFHDNHKLMRSACSDSVTSGSEIIQKKSLTWSDAKQSNGTEAELDISATKETRRVCDKKISSKEETIQRDSYSEGVETMGHNVIHSNGNRNGVDLLYHL